MAAVKLAEVAHRAGVSLATAFRVLNGSDRTPAEGIAEKVRAAAELGCVANVQAQALTRSATGLVGLVVHDIAGPYFSTITKGAQRPLRQNQRQLLLAAAVRDRARRAGSGVRVRLVSRGRGHPHGLASRAPRRAAGSAAGPLHRQCWPRSDAG